MTHRRPKSPLPLLDRPSAPSPHENWLQEPSARVLAASIQGYWRERGHKGVNVWVERKVDRTYFAKAFEHFVVRSNLVNGLPREVANKLAA